MASAVMEPIQTLSVEMPFVFSPVSRWTSPVRRPLRIFDLSDLHLGAPYADFKMADKVLKEGLKGYWDIDTGGKKTFIDHPADICVLKGDIFELINLPGKEKPISIFQYSRAIDKHIDYLRRLVLDHPDCKFVFIKGNHERIPEFDVALKSLERELGKDWLEIVTHVKVVADIAFAHGDQAASKGYRVSYKNPDDFSGADGRYSESYTELYRSRWLQAVHDFLNARIAWPVSLTWYHPRRCAEQNLNWLQDYDAQHPKETPVLEKVNHVSTGHTHGPQEKPYRYAFRKAVDSVTGKPKVFFLHNTGAALKTLGWKWLGGKNRINRDCFHAQSIILNTDNAGDPQAMASRIIAFNWPERRWIAEEPTEPGRSSPKPVVARHVAA